jgi:hypothetical protein
MIILYEYLFSGPSYDTTIIVIIAVFTTNEVRYVFDDIDGCIYYHYVIDLHINFHSPLLQFFHTSSNSCCYSYHFS